MKKLNLFILCIASLAFAFTSCDKDKGGDNNGDGDGNGSTSGYTVNVSVVDGASHDIDSVYMVFWYKDTLSEYGSYDVVVARAAYNKGEFKVTLPNTVDAKYMENIMDYLFEDDEINPDVTISDKTANILSNEAYLEAYKDGISVGYIELSDDSDPQDIFEAAVFTYLDRAVTIKGAVEDGKEKYVANMSFIKGWNTMCYKKYIQNGTYVFETTANNVASLKWYFDKNDSGGYGAPAKKVARVRK